MGDIISAISDDMDEYEDLCRRYKQDVRYKPDAYGHQLVDCYGTHADELKKRRDREEKLYTESPSYKKPTTKKTSKPKKPSKPLTRYDIIKGTGNVRTA